MEKRIENRVCPLLGKTCLGEKCAWWSEEKDYDGKYEGCGYADVWQESEF